MRWSFKRYSFFLSLGLLMLLATSCSEDYIKDPDNPERVSTSALFGQGIFSLMNDTRNQWFSTRAALIWMQYWAQSDYTSEARYSYRESQIDDGWNDIYSGLNIFKRVIDINTDPEQMPDAARNGSNSDQIQMARIMLSFGFLLAVQTWGDIPYWSYGGRDNKDFQATSFLDKGIIAPKYVSQKEILEDISNELKEAQDLLSGEMALVDGDFIYNGNTDKWKRFAHSLRLRVALLLKHKEPALAQKIFDEAYPLAFKSNEDNAALKFGNNDLTASPMYKVYYMDNRRDFGVSTPFLELLLGYGENNPFKDKIDPRVAVYAQLRLELEKKNIVLKDSDYPYKENMFVGLPVGVEGVVARQINNYSLPGKEILKKDSKEYLMEFAEVCFIASEFKGWNQAFYENGIRASMEKWNVSPFLISKYLEGLPPANQENVITQKYIALYMDPHTAWSDYRRTSYPKTIVKPGNTYEDRNGNSNKFLSLQGYTMEDIPYRFPYPKNESSLNGKNYDVAKESLGGLDRLTGKLWWMP